MHRIVRRTASILAVPALSLTVLAAGSAPASAAVDPAPATAAGSWLAAQVPESGLFAGSFGPDFGLSIDVALALDEAGGQDETAARTRDAVADDVESYISFSYEDAGVTHTGQSGGSTAKTLVLAEETGGTPTNFGGVDLVERLESLISDESGSEGRVIGTFDGAPDASYTNTYIQALAADGLEAVGSDRLDDVTGYLLDQQCAGGFFRGEIPTGRECTDDAPDTDSTAQAVLALIPQADDSTAVADALDAARNWLLQEQNERNGSFGGGPSTEGANTNSTGLAAVALAALGEDDAAARAAAWVRAHQTANVENCVYYAEDDLGATAYDTAALKAVQGGGIGADTVDQFRRATAQALPALALAPAGVADPNVLFSAEYVRAGGRKPVGVTGATPGEALCAMLGEQSVLRYANADGEADLPVLIPGRTATSRVKVANAGGTFGTAVIKALGAKKLPFTLESKVAKGKNQVVKVRGLAPAEIVSVRFNGRRVASGQAGAKGIYSASFKVTGKAGKAKVAVTGQFVNRKASKAFTVTR